MLNVIILVDFDTRFNEKVGITYLFFDSDDYFFGGISSASKKRTIGICCQRT
jgi:hypothetical protein